jgi:hypothetical protein
VWFHFTLNKAVITRILNNVTDDFNKSNLREQSTFSSRTECFLCIGVWRPLGTVKVHIFCFDASQTDLGFVHVE